MKRRILFCRAGSDQDAAFLTVPLPARLPRSARLAKKTPRDPLTLRERAERKWWLWPHLLSLDAPLVAITWQWWWSTTQGVHLPPSRYLILGSSVWLIYLADRLADAKRATPGERLLERHGFYVMHRTPMGWLLAFVAAALVFTTPALLPGREFLCGLVFLGVTAVYYWLTHCARPRARPGLPKESVVAGIFALGSALFTGCLMPPSPAWLLVGTVLFGALCFLNCALISAWEQCPQDLADPASMLNRFPWLTAHLNWGTILLVLSVLCLAPWDRSGSSWPVASSAFALWVLDQYRTRLSLQALRVLADVVLLTPLLAFCWKAASR